MVVGWGVFPVRPLQNGHKSGLGLETLQLLTWDDRFSFGSPLKPAKKGYVASKTDADDPKATLHKKHQVLRLTWLAGESFGYDDGTILYLLYSMPNIYIYIYTHTYIYIYVYIFFYTCTV